MLLWLKYCLNFFSSFVWSAEVIIFSIPVILIYVNFLTDIHWTEAKYILNYIHNSFDMHRIEVKYNLISINNSTSVH